MININAVSLTYFFMVAMLIVYFTFFIIFVSRAIDVIDKSRRDEVSKSLRKERGY